MPPSMRASRRRDLRERWRAPSVRFGAREGRPTRSRFRTERACIKAKIDGPVPIAHPPGIRLWPRPCAPGDNQKLRAHFGNEMMGAVVSTMDFAEFERRPAFSWSPTVYRP